MRRIAGPRRRRPVIFKKKPVTLPGASKSNTSPDRLAFKGKDTAMAGHGSNIVSAPSVPDLFTSPPVIRDELDTESSIVQDDTVRSCLPYLCGQDDDVDIYNVHGLPPLARDQHIRFLHSQLKKLPGRFVALDASRPWYLYWCLAGLTLLGEDVSSYRGAVAETARSMQNDSGGFGGGGQQLSHLATTYAIVLALALVGGEEAFEVVDRKKLWKWLCMLKQPDGGFQVCVGGEEDIRGAYCAAVIISLLNIPLELTRDSPAWTADGTTLLTGLAEWVRRCQTFEGGISGQPDVEAHGAYAFCALGCLSILGSPATMIPRYLDVPRLIAWLSSRQYAPEGGFSGRTNKLVDGCYSHWVGGCWPLIEASLNGSPAASCDRDPERRRLPPVTDSLFSREGLIRYILCCCQDQTQRGGLRDKPGKYSDPYHSCYVLSGLSSAQHLCELVDPSDEPRSLLEWKVSRFAGVDQIIDEQHRVQPLDPVYVLPIATVLNSRQYFESKAGF